MKILMRAFLLSVGEVVTVGVIIVYSGA